MIAHVELAGDREAALFSSHKAGELASFDESFASPDCEDVTPHERDAAPEGSEL